jgi:hypothetical protein
VIIKRVVINLIVFQVMLKCQWLARRSHDFAKRTQIDPITHKFDSLGAYRRIEKGRRFGTRQLPPQN